MSKPARGSCSTGKVPGSDRRRLPLFSRWRALVLGVIAATSLGLVSQARAASPVEDWLRDANLSAADVGLIAVPLGGGDALVQLNAQLPMNPASTMKIVTTYAALSVLGPDYRWRTRAYLRGRLDRGTLHGDLVLRGGGDPEFLVEDLAAFVSRMREAGLRDLRGDLVLDDSLFDLQGESGEAFDGDASQPYNVSPDGMLMNFKAARLVVTPGRRGVRLAFDPPLAGVRIDNLVRPAGGPCVKGTDGLNVDSGAGRSPWVRVSGVYPRVCGEQGAFVAVLSHRAFAEALFRGVWEAAGGTWTGHARMQPGAANGAEPWLEWTSPRTLADVVHDVNKFSNNVMARELLLCLGAKQWGQATPARARGALRAWLSADGLALPELVIDNGSGLSRSERISAASLAMLLVHAAASPVADTLRESLPLVGVDGTMKSRMIGEPIAGRAWIKTGSLDGVRAIAGYVDGESGRRWAVAMIVNAEHARIAKPVQDEFLRWVWANG